MSDAAPKTSVPKKTPLSIWIGMGVLLLVPVARWSLEEIDHQYANIATALLIAVGVLALTIGILRRLPWVATIVYLVTVILAIALFSRYFEFRGFTGELVPTFRWRAQSIPSDREGLGQTGHDEAVERLKPWTTHARFTQFLGNDRSGKIQSPSIDLDWHANGPTPLWRVQVADGWSGITVADGMVWTLLQDPAEEAVVCYELATGREKWRTRFPGRHTEPMGGTGPRSTPTWQDGKLWIQTAVGIAACLDASQGTIEWQKDLLREGFASQSESEQSIKWGRSGSPLLVQSSGQLLVIYPLGGKPDTDQSGSLIAMDASSGEVKWKGGAAQIAYGSPMLMKLAGVEQIVAIHEGIVAGHSVETGDVLWSSPWESHSNADACSSSPVDCSSDRILLGKGYAAGSKLIRIGKSQTDGPASWSAEDVWANHRILKTKLTNAIYHSDRLYGLSDGILECVEPETGKRIWRGGRYGQGQLLVVNNRLMVTSEDGRLILVEPDQGKELHAIDVLDGVTWNYPAVAGPFILMRNGSEMVCFFFPSEEGIQSKSVQP